MTDSSSAFIAPADFSAEWRDITLVNQRSHTRIYTATRYGRRFLLKALAPEDTELTDFRLQQEREFQLGIQLVHPNIAATYSLEPVKGIGRCIVQEWIDGLTLADWLQTKPTKSARERVFLQLLDALEYLHSLQLVHHDIKADNILITRNGANVKLIDFGLSATDATLSPVPNDPRADILALRRLFPSFVPNGSFANIAALRHAIARRKRVIQALPLVVLFLLLTFAGALLYISWNERQISHAELAQTTLQLAESRQELEAATQAIDNGVDVDEIRALIDSIYRPVYDSLRLPDARYYEIASVYFSVLPRPMKEYNRLIARYKVGSVAYAAFSEAWLNIQNQKMSDLVAQMKRLPYYTKEYEHGCISQDEYLRLIELHRAIHNRHTP